MEDDSSVAFWRGFYDCKEGYSIIDNPYNNGTNSYLKWEIGFNSYEEEDWDD